MSEIKNFDRRFFLAGLSKTMVVFAFFKFSQLPSSETSGKKVISKLDDEFVVIGGWVMLKEDLIG